MISGYSSASNPTSSQGLLIQDKHFPMRYSKEKENQELFIRTTMAARPNPPLKLNANVVGKFVVEQFMSDKAAQRAHNTSHVASKPKMENKVQMIDGPTAVTPTVQKATGTAGPKKKAASKAPQHTPTIVKNYASSAPQPTQAPSAPSVSLPKDVEAHLRQRLVHDLALGAAPVPDVLKRVGGVEADQDTRTKIIELLHEVR